MKHNIKIKDDVLKKSRFFRKVKHLIQVLYDEYMTRNHIETHIYKRPMRRVNLGNLKQQYDTAFWLMAPKKQAQRGR